MTSFAAAVPGPLGSPLPVALPGRWSGPLVSPAGLRQLRLALAVAGNAAGTRVRVRPPGRPTAAAAPEPRTPIQPAKPPDPELARLAERASAGDTEAFGALYDRYVDLVYRYVFYRVGSAALAEDLTSDTFLRPLRAISRYRDEGKDFGAWLLTIARNLVFDHFKSGRFRLEFSAADLVGTAAERVEPGPEGAVLEALSNEELLRAIKRLAPDQQECIALRFLAGASVSETALAMGRGENAVKALQYRAVRSLARLLPQERG